MTVLKQEKEQKEEKNKSSEDILHFIQTDYKYVRMSGKSEENAKIKLVIPIFQAFGYDMIKDMDFEVVTPTGAAVDIVLLKDSNRVAVVETKDIDRNLGLDAEQALRYGHYLHIEWVFLSNGNETRVFNLQTWDSPLVSFFLREFKARYDELLGLFHRDHMPQAPALRKCMEGIPLRDPSLQASLLDAVNANDLFQDLKELLLGINKDGERVFREKPPKESSGYWACERAGEKGSFLSLQVRSKGPLEVYMYRKAYHKITDQSSVTESIRVLPGIVGVSPNQNEGHIKFNIVDGRGTKALVEFCRSRLI